MYTNVRKYIMIPKVFGLSANSRSFYEIVRRIIFKFLCDNQSTALSPASIRHRNRFTAVIFNLVTIMRSSVGGDLIGSL